MASTPGEHGGAFPPFDSSTYASQLIWLAITFGALYFIVAKIALPRLANIVEGRAERIESDLAEAKRLRAESKAAEDAFLKAQADARAKASAIATEAREAVARQSDENRRRLDTEMAAKLAAAETQIAATKQAAMGNVRGIAADAAAAIVERLSGATPATAEIEQAVDATLAR
nr:F0F1 ATP synthase subunit B' [Methylopila jiangsuensis]